MCDVRHLMLEWSPEQGGVAGYLNEAVAAEQAARGMPPRGMQACSDESMLVAWETLRIGARTAER